AVPDRRRGAVRGYGTLRRAADPDRVARPRDARAGAVLLRPGRADARRSVGAGQSVLLAGAGRELDLRAGRAVDARDHHRVAGADHRRVLADPPGDPARAVPAGPDPPHLGARRGP